MTGRKADISVLFYKLPVGDTLGFGFSQFNEVLSLLGFDRINRPFFDFLCEDGNEIKSIEQLEYAVKRFMTIALLFFGNIEHAFQTLSSDEEALNDILNLMLPTDMSAYMLRHPPILSIEKIPASKTYYLGYLVQSDIKAALDADPNDPKALEDKQICDQIVEQGKRNQEAYLVADHMDVYVATSMREKHEFLLVSKLCDKIFASSILSDLNLRYFDPTQAYCDDRIDKGLSESLMLKRARCTIYMAQEADTLGKDCELASTLAQGKPVIAFVPHGTKQYVSDLVKELQALHPEKQRRELILDQLRIFAPELAWIDPSILDADESALFTLLTEKVKASYDKRAKTLSENHPLGIQVDLRSGVANGVLVVRSVDDCIKLLRAVLENNLKFDVVAKSIGNETYWLLKEKISSCIFRAITANKCLTNSFWNHYLVEEDFGTYL